MSESFIFHGVDGKVGTTMVAQSAAEVLAELFPEKSTLFLALNGRRSTEYVREEAESLDKLKSRIESRMLAEEELAAHCANIRNLFILGGINNEEEERYYMPELASQLIALAERRFDFTVVDSGSRLDNGLAFGALSSSPRRFLVMTQQETLLARWEERKGLYEKLSVAPEAYILNHYMEKDIYPLEYVARRLGSGREKFHKIAFSYGGRRAEIERKTLRVTEDAFAKDIVRLVDHITLGAAGRSEAGKRRRKWKSFI
jgi:hypothetical protein